ncbi:hypothetical protein EYF80_012672 [Liparis tanakae]|uniref:Uncharacterized protein n=1 Tax=Liparis tanakae TaxID=230148 RepID=A0A4Z2IHV2_9TELE|nr:hypothetical protein EYF80_012672 [Liparis tanakae]
MSIALRKRTDPFPGGLADLQDLLGANINSQHGCKQEAEQSSNTLSPQDLRGSVVVHRSNGTPWSLTSSSSSLDPSWCVAWILYTPMTTINTSATIQTTMTAVLRLGRHMVDMFHRSRVVKNTNLQHKGEKKTFILRKEKHRASELHTIPLARVVALPYIDIPEEELVASSSESRTGPVFHPGCYGELVGQVLGHHVIWNVSRLMAVESVDEVAVAAAVSQQGGRPVCGRAGGGEEVVKGSLKGPVTWQACWKEVLDSVYLSVSLPGSAVTPVSVAESGADKRKREKARAEDVHLVKWLPKHGAELIDIVHLDVNHRPEWRKEGMKERGSRDGGSTVGRMQRAVMIDGEKEKKVGPAGSGPAVVGLDYEGVLFLALTVHGATGPQHALSRCAIQHHRLEWSILTVDLKGTNRP